MPLSIPEHRLMQCSFTFSPRKQRKAPPRRVFAYQNQGQVNLAKCASGNCLTLGVHSTGPQLRGWSRDESRKCFAIREQVGGREGIRTPDPLLAKQVLYTATVGVAFILKHFPRFQNPFPRIFMASPFFRGVNP
jgi:hypothetical protein